MEKDDYWCWMLLFAWMTLICIDMCQQTGQRRHDFHEIKYEIQMLRYAKDCQCVVCGKKAVAFWPVCDIDIPSHPYCRECLDKEKKELLIKLFGKEEGEMLMEMDKKNRN